MLLKPPLSELSSIFYCFSSSRINIGGRADAFFFSRFHLKAHFIVCEDVLAAAAAPPLSPSRPPQLLLHLFVGKRRWRGVRHVRPCPFSFSWPVLLRSRHLRQLVEGENQQFSAAGCRRSSELAAVANGGRGGAGRPEDLLNVEGSNSGGVFV